MFRDGMLIVMATRGSLTLWPSFLLVTTCAVLIGIPLLAVYCWGKLLIPWFRPGVTFDLRKPREAKPEIA